MTATQKTGLRLLGWIWQVKLTLQRWLIITTSVIFSLLVFVQVLFRYFLDIPLFGLEEIAVYMGVWLYFIGYAFAASRKFHISASLVEAFMKPGRGQDLLEALAMLITTVIAGWMTVWGFEYFLWTVKIGSKSVELDLPLAWIYAAIPLGLGLSTLYYGIEFIEKVCHAIYGDDSRCQILQGDHP